MSSGVLWDCVLHCENPKTCVFAAILYITHTIYGNSHLKYTMASRLILKLDRVYYIDISSITCYLATNCVMSLLTYYSFHHGWQVVMSMVTCHLWQFSVSLYGKGWLTKEFVWSVHLPIGHPGLHTLSFSVFLSLKTMVTHGCYPVIGS